jgi:dTDP-4-amino-4,6-dideoxy-D-galactose acyltransferase
VTPDSAGTGEPCELLTWDTAHFGVRIGRVRDRRLVERGLREVLAWGADENIDCLFLLADAADANTQRVVQSYGFRFVDVRVTLARPLTDDEADRATHDVTVRSARADDAAALVSLAGNGYRDSRFYADGRFSPAAVDQLYKRWLLGALDGSLADLVLVAEESGEPVGYVTALLDGDRRSARIDLMGVSTRSRGKGVGRALVSSALREFVEAGMATARVVTQGRNVPAQRLYQSCGFRTDLVEVWYHLWTDEQRPRLD